MLDEYSDLMNRIERTIHHQLQAGRKWRGDLAVSLYKDFGISAKLIESPYRSLMGKLAAVAELSKLHATELDGKIRRKQAEIDRKAKSLTSTKASLTEKLDRLAKMRDKLVALKQKLDQAKPAQQPKALQRYKSELGKIYKVEAGIADDHQKIKRLKAGLHQHKRRCSSLQQKYQKMPKHIDNPSICFGSKVLFRKQYNLTLNGYGSHAEWKADWVSARSSTFIIEGLASAPGGNQYAVLKKNKQGLFDLILRLPEAMKHHATEIKQFQGREMHYARLNGLHFAHNFDLLETALAGQTSISIRFHRDEGGWRILASFEPDTAEAIEDYRCGAIGVDLNVGFVSVARTDRFGNVVETFDVPMVTYGKSQGQSDTIVRQAVSKIVVYAKQHDLPIVSEKLDFSAKKLRLAEENPRYARMLSSFVYSAFDAALASACARSSIFHRRVNSAYTSLIGRTRFASRYGLSVHAAASFAIARRAMRMSEKLPSSFKDNVITLPLNDAHLVTLELPVRKDNDPGKADRARHVWSDWRRVNLSLKGTLAACRPSRRKRPSQSIPMGRNDLHSMVCRRRRTVSGVNTQPQDQRVGSDAIAV